jgi:hypothetical protein
MVVLDYNTLVQFNLMVILMLFLIVWVNAMSHISRYDETLIQSFVVGIHFTASKDFIESLHRGIHESRISSLCTIRTAFLMIKETCHTYPRTSLLIRLRDG